MLPRTRPFLTCLVLCLVPLLLLAFINYWAAASSAETQQAKALQQDLSRFSLAVDKILDEHGAVLSTLAESRALSQHVSGVQTSVPGRRANLTETNNSSGNLPLELQSSLAVVLNKPGHYQRVICFDRNKQPLFVAEAGTLGQRESPSIRSFVPNMPQPDERVWNERSTTVLYSPVATQASFGSSVLFTVPVFGKDNAQSAQAALVGQLNLDSILAEAYRVVEPNPISNETKSLVIVLDRSGRILYHPNDSLKHQPVATAMPSFSPVADPMMSNQSGTKRFSMSTGQDLLAAFTPLTRLDGGVAVAGDRTQALGGARRTGLIEIGMSVAIAFVAALLMERYLRRPSKGIAQVTEGVAAIAQGQLDRNIVVGSGDDARVIADNINLMAERMREQLARESEARQFDSFVRLSAMLTHDLKNAIEALSLIVGNMELHFDNKEFRVDMMKSLTIATEKLKALVARISNPVTTLSGEHKMPRPTDLVASIQHVVSLVVEPVRSKYQVELKLPSSVYALADADRIERVIQNLVINALEAMNEKGGKLTIEAGEAGPGKVFLTVGDTGPGMSNEFIENRLFRPFSTTKRSGVGLGLYTCREVVRANGGAIEVQSKQGVGTTFRVVLPSATIEGHN